MGIRNINTIAADLIGELIEHEKLAKSIQGANTSPVKAFLNYEALKTGVQLLQIRFLEAMDRGELDYSKINRE